MKCPYCTNTTTEVMETRDSEDLMVTRRRRECKACTKRFTTYERIENVTLIVLKKDGTRESFDREKLDRGIRRAAEKTSVTPVEVDLIVNEIERELRSADSIEVKSSVIGHLVATKLKGKDKVAYIRFASVFKQFVDVEEFEKEVQLL